MKFKAFNFLIIFSVAALYGCATKAGAFKIYQQELEALEGKSFDGSYVWYVGYLGKVEPTEVKRLDNGNEIRIYEFTQNRLSLLTWNRTIETCKVYVDLDVKTGLINSASSRGIGCYRPY